MYPPAARPLERSLSTSLEPSATTPPYWGIRSPQMDHVENTWDFRQGVGEWTVSGSGSVFDSVRGFIPNSSGARILLSDYDDTNVISEGTLLIEFERAGVLFDVSYATTAPTFVDSSGQIEASGSKWLLRLNEISGNVRELQAYFQSHTGSLLVVCEQAVGDANSLVRVFEHYPTELDSTWAVLAITWGVDGRVYFLLDGMVIGSFDRDIIHGDISDFALGQNLGDFGIRRVQMLSQSIAPELSRTRVAIVGDSFGSRYTSRATPTTDIKADYDAVQNALQYDTELASNDVSTSYFQTHTAWGFSDAFKQLQQSGYIRTGKWQPIYNASKNGYGWRSDLSVQFTQAQKDALVGYDPEILWCFGSVNDISVSVTIEDIVGDIQTWLGDVVALCNNIRKVYFVETLDTEESRSDVNLSTYITNSNALRVKQATLDGYTLTTADLRSVPIEFIPAYASWNDTRKQSGYYAIGSHPDNSTSTARTPTVHGDRHPTAEGSRKIATILKGLFLKDIS